MRFINERETKIINNKEKEGKKKRRRKKKEKRNDNKKENKIIVNLWVDIKQGISRFRQERRRRRDSCPAIPKAET